MCEEMLSALLVYTEAEHFPALATALKTPSIHIRRAATCGEAWLFLRGPDPPHLVFTDTQMADGGWAEVLSMVNLLPAAVNVIVVARALDKRLYLEALEAGAFDFITPPFAALDLAHVVRVASSDVFVRRAKGQRRRWPTRTKQGVAPAPLRSGTPPPRR